LDERHLVFIFSLPTKPPKIINTMSATNSPRENERKRSRIERDTFLPRTLVHRRSGSNGSIRSGVSSLNEVTETSLLSFQSGSATVDMDTTTVQFEEYMPSSGAPLPVEFMESSPEAFLVLPTEERDVLDPAKVRAMMIERPRRSFLLMGGPRLMNAILCNAHDKALLAKQHQEHLVPKSKTLTLQKEFCMGRRREKLANLVKAQEAYHLEDKNLVEVTNSQLRIDDDIRTQSRKAKKYGSIKETIEPFVAIQPFENSGKAAFQFHRKRIPDIRKVLELESTQAVVDLTREELIGIFRILKYGGYEDNEDFKKMWTFPSKNATSLETMADWINVHGETPTISLRFGNRSTLELRLCHYLQLPEPVDLNINSHTCGTELLEKMKAIGSTNMTRKEAMDMANHLYEKFGLEQIKEENGEDNDNK